MNHQLDNLHSGTVTFLFTDIQGSTQLLKQLGEAYTKLLVDQRTILRSTFEKFDGREVDTQGDSFFASFPRATQAVAAVIEIQRTLAAHIWPSGVKVHVRMGLHTGEPWLVEEGYVGMDVHRAARIAHTAHGGQVLLSETTTSLIRDELPEGVELLDLGAHRLKDMRRPENIHQLVISGLPNDFPPLNSLEHLSESDILVAEATKLQPQNVGESPYRGLSAFREDDSPFFFGREAFSTQLMEAVLQRRLVAIIVGSSGSGKSSAVFAGLLPQLRGEDEWLIVQMRPGSQPFQSLAVALVPLLDDKLSETEHLVEAQRLAGALRAGEVSLKQVVERILDKHPVANRLLLVVDQFEELFTLNREPETQIYFLDELLSTAQFGESHHATPMVSLLTLRADFMGQALTHRPFADALQEGSLMLGPMNREELRAAIEKPAELQGAAFEIGLVSRILDDVGQEPGNLPLLEFALTLLWDRMEQGWLTHNVYDKIGRVEGALARYADEVYSYLTAEEQEQARKVFVQLVQPGQGTEDTRRVARREDLVVDWRLVQHLADSRLVVTGLDQAGNETVEVVHEALIRGWGQLRFWMAADRAFRNWQEGLRATLRGWENSERDEGALLRGAPLAQSVEWLAERGDEIGDAEKEYIQNSTEFQEMGQRKRDRRRRLTIGGLAVGLVITIFLSVFAFQQREEALRQASIGLASQAKLELDGTLPERSVLLALDALEEYPYTWQAEQALGEIVREFRLRYIVMGHDDTVMDMAWSPDGSRFATTGKDGTLRIWDATTRIETISISAHLAFAAGTTLGAPELAWSPDGYRIVTAGLDKTAKVWDAITGKEIVTFSGHSDEVRDVTWSVDGTWIASASKGGEVIIWDSKTGMEKYSFPINVSPVNSVSWSPDGKQIATAGGDGIARIWNAETGELQFELFGHTNEIWSVAWSPDGVNIATSSDDGTVRIWDVKKGREISDLRLASPVWDVAWSPDGERLATTSGDGLARAWDVASGKESFKLQGRILEPFDIAWSADGMWLATTAGQGFSVRLWDATSDTLTLSGAQEGMQWVSWAPDSNRLVTAGLDKTAVVWDVNTGEPLLTFREHTDWVQDAFWSPDGSQIVSTDWDNVAMVWDANNGKVLVKFSGHVGEPISKFNGVDALFGGGWSPDGSRIVTNGGDGSVRVWDAKTGKEYLVFQATKDSGVSARWSPDGTRLASCAIPAVLQIWDATTGKSILGGYAHNTADLSFGDTVDYCVQGDWSPDGKKILTTSWGGNGATIWNGETGEKIIVFKGHTGGIGFSTWSPNGKRIASGDTNGEVKIWDAETGAVLLNFSVPNENYLFQLAWSPDGTRLTGVGLTNSIEIYRVWQTKEDLIAYAKDCCVIRELTQEERQQFGLP